MNNTGFKAGLAFSFILVLSLSSTTLLADPAGSNPQVDSTITFHGFVNVSFFWQNQNFFFGNGQDAEWPTTNNGSNHDLSGVDVRNTRVWMDLGGITLSSGWVVNGHLEGDFFGGFNGSGPYSAEQQTPRLRQAFVTLSNVDSGSSITIGQQYDLVLPIDAIPESLAHLAFPLGYGTGLIGYYFPGVVYSQNFGRPSVDSLAWRMDLGAFTGSWNGPGSNTNFDTAANVDFRPQIEARLRAAQGNWVGFLAGHYSSADLSGVTGTAPTAITGTITSTALELGTAWHPGPWSVVTAVYTGKALGKVLGAFTQFGDIKETGGYVQGGYKFTTHWGLYAFYASDHPNENDVITWVGQGSSGLLKNRQYALDLIYSDGPFGFGFEWLYDRIDSITAGTAPIINTSSGNQLSLSAIYNF